MAHHNLIVITVTLTIHSNIAFVTVIGSLIEIQVLIALFNVALKLQKRLLNNTP